MRGEDEGLDDPRLLTRSAVGDREAFASLVDRHQASVFRFARALTRDDAAAEDVLQQTFLSAWQAAGQFRGDAEVRTWLFTIARHAAQRQGERRARTAAQEESMGGVADLDELGAAAGWGGPDPEALTLAAEDRHRVQCALASLDDRDREILTLRDLEDMPGADVAALLGLSLPAMKSRLHRARLQLAAALTHPEAAHADRSR